MRADKQTVQQLWEQHRDELRTLHAEGIRGGGVSTDSQGNDYIFVNALNANEATKQKVRQLFAGAPLTINDMRQEFRPF